MSRDFVALVRNQPDVNTVIEGMLAYGAELEMRETPSGTVQLYDPAGVLLVSVEAPALVEAILRTWQTHRAAPDESFVAFARRHEIAALQALVAETGEAA